MGRARDALDEEAGEPLQTSDSAGAALLQPDDGASAVPPQLADRRHLERAASSSAQGSLANLLPVLEEGEEASQAEVLERVSAAPDHDDLHTRLRTSSEMSFDLESDLEDGADLNLDYTPLTDRGVRTPGDIRTAVLEWIYEEKDEEACPDLTVGNAPILEDLISVFVCAVLHGKSDVIRSQVWRFLIQGSIASLHFAFLVICNLNASCHQPASVSEDELSLDHKQKRAKDLAAIEKVIQTLKKDTIRKLETVRPVDSQAANGNAPGGGSAALDDLKATLNQAVDQLEAVHDNQVLTNLDLNVRGRTARQNIDLLVQKVRNSLVHSSGQLGEDALKELDGKIGFIKTLTDLDDWLMRAVPREERAKVLESKLQSLSVALPLGAYFPTAVGRATQRHRVLRLVLDETIVFNTARKCPFLLVAEVEPILSGPSDASLAQRELEEEERREPKTPGKVALEAFEMVSTKDFWKNPMKEIKGFKERTASDASLGTLHELHALTKEVEGDQNGESAGSGSQKEDHERWEDMQERVRRESPFGDRPRWQLASMFVKAGDDLRQQQLGVLFVSTFQKIFLEEGVPVWLAPYKVIATGRSCGLLEPARNSDSIARIKERGGFSGIDDYFVHKFGPNKNSRTYKRAQRNFLQSLAGYSIVAYLIKLHDRHNGNILVDVEGHLLHIDFGFMLGYSHKLERSPFKLTPDMVNVLGGAYSATFQKFRRLMEKAYIAANKHHRELILLAELMSVDDSSSECFAGGRRWVIDEFRARFCPGLPTRKLKIHINDIIDQSLSNYTTRCYDKYQRCVNGIW